MVGGYLGAWASVSLQLPLIVSFLVAIVLMAIFGLIWQRIVYVPLHDKPMATFVVASLAAGIVMENAAQLIFGAEPRAIPAFFGGTVFRVATVSLSSTYVTIIVVTFLVLVLQHLLFTRTLFGKMLRATGQDPATARLMGIRVHNMVAFTFVFSAMLSAIAGFLLAPVVFIYPLVGLPLIVNGFIGAVIGGFGSIPGAVVGGILVGLAQVLLAAYVSTTWTSVFLFAIFIAFLAIFPRGIFGESISEKV